MEKKMSVSEIAKLTGVSVRTLHYYDEIGLLKPDEVDEQNGYRFYRDNALEKLQLILFYRELEFPLKEIISIVSCPNFNKNEALQKQKTLLALRKERIERLMNAIDSAIDGGNTMNFNAFDNSEYEAERQKYADEARKKWGNTAAFKENERKTAEYNDEKWIDVNSGMDSLMNEFAACKSSGNTPESAPAQALVKKWQDFITANYYTCTNEILAGLGEMYVADERFKANIDKHGDGTAEFMTSAIKAFCQ